MAPQTPVPGPSQPTPPNPQAPVPAPIEPSGKPITKEANPEKPIEVDSSDENEDLAGQINKLQGIAKHNLNKAKAKFTAENQELRNEILRLSTHLQEVAALGQQQANLNLRSLGVPEHHGKDPGEVLKLPKPEPYDGTPVKLQEFLTSLQQHFAYYPQALGSNNAKAQFAVTRLTGTTRTWFQPIIDQYLSGKAEAAVVNIFHNYSAFKTQMRQIFAPINEERKNRNKIKRLKQLGSTAAYSAKFKALAALIPWDETYLREAYYNGLKEEVKDEVSKILTPPTKLNEYIQLAVQIDEALYSRRQEKKGKGRSNNQSNQGKKRQEQNGNTSWGTHARPMEISNLEQGRNKEKKPQRNIRNNSCFNYGKKGHFTRDYRAPKKDEKRKPKEVSTMEDAKEVGIMKKPKAGHRGRDCPARTDTSHGTYTGPINTKKTTKHDTLPWVKCFNNNCTTHQDAKKNNGWYPREISVWEHGDEYLQDQEYNEYTTDNNDNDEGYGHLAQGTYLGNENPNRRYNPTPTGRDEIIAIRAIKLAHAVGRKLNPRGEFGDHPALSVSHKDHADLAWVSCFNNTCEDHAEEKAKNGAYPVRGGQTYNDPYWWNQVRGYRVYN
jgi:hypothetical protein